MRPHATYVPQPPRPRRALHSHAQPIEQPSTHHQAEPRRPKAAKPAARRAEPRAAAALRWPAALWISLVLTCGLAALIVLARVVPLPVPGPAGRYVLPALAAGTFVVLVRAHVRIETYRWLRHHTGLTASRWTDHAVALLFGLSLVMTVAVIALLLAWGEAMLVGVLLS